MAKTELITRTEFAKRCGVSVAAISKAVNKAPLRQCIEGKFINAGHREARQYLRGKKPGDDLRKNATHTRGSAAAKKKRQTTNPTGVQAAPPVAQTTTTTTPTGSFIPPQETHRAYGGEQSPEPETEHDGDDIAQYLDMTLEQILVKFGDNSRFNEWLKAIKEIESIRDKRLRNDERENKYVPREIALQVFGRYERCFKLQLADATRSIAAQLHDNVEAGGTLEESIELTEDLIGAPIADAKKNVGILLKEYVDNGR
jgi:hypothetical protein